MTQQRRRSGLGGGGKGQWGGSSGIYTGGGASNINIEKKQWVQVNQRGDHGHP